MKQEIRHIELLAPARDLTTGIEAIRHGADAVYIGAQHFGARANAGNSVEDIGRLVEYAHPYGVKIYVTLNTILYDHELDEVKHLVRQLENVGVDALIVQDMALLSIGTLLPLHASTQMDNRTADKVKWLHGLGFEQVVLARELTLDEITEIHRQVPEARLEVFVHGAICVSYNGQCYASQHCFGRSANRGECAQFCRMPFDLEDDASHTLQRRRHLLSLRDMNRSDKLEALLNAGVSSLKIEGRLKDVAYVKNVVAHYRQRLDELFCRRPEYQRSSLGHEYISFTPNPAKSFNRLFTNYFLQGRTPDMANIFTPKSMGEPLEGQALHNGDGLCYIDKEGNLVGFRVNRAEDYKPRKGLYRNLDHDFEQQLAKPTATRKVGVRWLLQEVPDGFRLRLTREDGAVAEQTFSCPHEEARTSQHEQIERQLARLGDTPYESIGVEIQTSRHWFIPASRLSEWRREVIKILLSSVKRSDAFPPSQSSVPLQTKWVGSSLTYLANVSNQVARNFYLEQGASHVDWALEVGTTHREERKNGLLLMTCRYCIRHELGLCAKGRAQQQLYLRLTDGRRFRLEFDCKQCKMMVYAE